MLTKPSVAFSANVFATQQVTVFEQELGTPSEYGVPCLLRHFMALDIVETYLDTGKLKVQLLSRVCETRSGLRQYAIAGERLVDIAKLRVQGKVQEHRVVRHSVTCGLIAAKVDVVLKQAGTAAHGTGHDVIPQDEALENAPLRRSVDPLPPIAFQPAGLGEKEIDVAMHEPYAGILGEEGDVPGDLRWIVEVISVEEAEEVPRDMCLCSLQGAKESEIPLVPLTNNPWKCAVENGLVALNYLPGRVTRVIVRYYHFKVAISLGEQTLETVIEVGGVVVAEDDDGY
jgi:hypothetical protein